MGKSKISFSKTVKYFREISVIVIGVAITLFASNLISNRSVKKEIALSMNAIKMELERNANAFEQYGRLLKKSTRYREYLYAHDEKSYSKDTIEYYAYTNSEGIGWGELSSTTLFTKNAFEMLKTSGTMRHIADKELLENIWEIYSMMENVQHFLDECFQWKKEIRMNEMLTDNYEPAQMYLFYRLGAVPYMEYSCLNMAEKIRNVLLKLE